MKCSGRSPGGLAGIFGVSPGQAMRQRLHLLGVAQAGPGGGGTPGDGAGADQQQADDVPGLLPAQHEVGAGPRGVHRDGHQADAQREGEALQDHVPPPGIV